jgi:hypothetical protein
MDPRCKLCVFMGKTDPGAARHQQQSMILVSHAALDGHDGRAGQVPFDAPGVRVVRPLSVFGDKEGPTGHAEV